MLQSVYLYGWWIKADFSLCTLKRVSSSFKYIVPGEAAFELLSTDSATEVKGREETTIIQPKCPTVHVKYRVVQKEGNLLLKGILT